MARTLAWIAGWAALALTTAPSAAQVAAPDLPLEDGLNGTQREEVLELITSFLLNNPDVLRKALDRMEVVAKTTTPDGNVGRILAAAPEAARQAFGDPARGAAIVVNPAGTTTLVIACDYACPYCRTTAPQLASLLRRRPDLRVVFRETPYLSPESDMAARVGLAIARQSPDRYLRYHLALMTRRGPLTEDAVLAAAAKAEADLARIAETAADPALAAGLDANRTLMRGLGLIATPMLLANDTLRSGLQTSAALDRLVAPRR